MSGAVCASVLRYQCSDGSTYEPSRIVEPPRTVIGEKKIQPVGMPVPTARMSVIERGVHRASFTTKHSYSLRR